MLNQIVKVSILSWFGDISLAIGTTFEPYLETTLGILRQAGVIQVMSNPLSPFFSFTPNYKLTCCSEG